MDKLRVGVQITGEILLDSSEGDVMAITSQINMLRRMLEMSGYGKITIDVRDINGVVRYQE